MSVPWSQVLANLANGALADTSTTVDGSPLPDASAAPELGTLTHFETPLAPVASDAKLVEDLNEKTRERRRIVAAPPEKPAASERPPWKRGPGRPRKDAPPLPPPPPKVPKRRGRPPKNRAPDPVSETPVPVDPMDSLFAGAAEPVPAPEPKKPEKRLARAPWNADGRFSGTKAQVAEREAARVIEAPPVRELTLEERVLSMTPEQLEEFEKELAAWYAKASFAEFFRQAWKVLEPATELVWNWHLQLICCVVQAIFLDWLRTKRDKNYVNKIRNLLVNVPPGSSKSRILSVAFEAWAWLHWPGMKFLCLSVNDDAAMRDARAMRDLVRSKWYVESFKPEWSLKQDQDAISNFGNTKGGERLSMPSKSVVVGLRGDLICIDDPNDPKGLDSRNDLDDVNTNWDSTQCNRVNDLQRSLRFGVQQRITTGDWTDHVIKIQGTWSPENPDGWLHVVLPGEFDPARKFVMPECLAAILREYLPEEEILLCDPRTEPNEPLDKSRAPASVLEGERKRWAATSNYEAQINQRPANTKGAKVQRQWWGWFRLVGGIRDNFDELDLGRPRPEHCHNGEALVVHGKLQAPGQWDFDWITISVDPAAKKTDKGSNYGMLVIAGKGGRRFVLDDRTQRGAFHEIIDILKEMIRFWEPDTLLIEPKAAGPDIMDTLREQMGAGDCPMVAIEEADPGNQDKEMRLEAAMPYIKNGMVYLLDGAPWVKEFVEELSLFPHGERDDRVDSLSQALNHIRAEDDVWPTL